MNVLGGGDEVAAFRAAERTYWTHHGLDPRERYVALPDLRTTVRVLEAGDGPPLLYVHGGLTMGSEWAPLVAGLGGYRHLVVDRPGYGLSASVDYRTVEPRAFSVGVLTGLLDTLGIDSLSVVGSSFGGTIAFWLASDHPERVESLLQLGLPSFVPGMAVPSWMRLLSVRGLNRLATGMQTPSTPQAISMLRNVGHGTTLDADRIPVEFLELYAAYERLPWFGDTLTELEALVRFRGVRPRYAFTENSLGEVTQPTLLVCGEDDPFGGQVVAERTAAVLDDALLEVIENGGHLPWLDRQTLCSRLVMGFLTDHGTVPLSIEVERT